MWKSIIKIEFLSIYVINNNIYIFYMNKPDRLNITTPSEQFTVYMYTIHCTLYSVQCTLYTVYSVQLHIMVTLYIY